MIDRKERVLAIHLQTRGLAFVLFEAWIAPNDWAVHEARGPNKNALCLKRVSAIFALHTPDVVVLQEMPEGDTRRVLRIRRLNGAIADLAQRNGISVRTYPRTELREWFAYYYGATTKQKIAVTIAAQISALNL